MNYIRNITFGLILVRGSVDFCKDYRLSVIGHDVNFNIIILAFVISTNLLLCIHWVKDSKMKLSKVNALLICMLFIFGLSLFYSVDVSGSREELFRIISLFGMIPLMFAVINNTKDLNIFLKIYLWSIFIPVTVGIIQLLFFRDYLLFNGLVRVGSTFDQSGMFANYLSLMAIFIFGLLYKPFGYSARKKKCLLFLLVVLIFLLLMTYTRGALIGLFVASLMTSWTISKRFFLKVSCYSLLFIMLISPIFLSRFTHELGKSSAGVRDVEISSSISVHGSYASRLLFMIYAWNQMFVVSPMMGQGLGSFYYHYSELVFHEKVEVHNDAIKLLSEVGIVGAISYYLLFFYILKILFRAYVIGDIHTKRIMLIGIAMTWFMLFESITNASLRLLPVQFYYLAFLGVAWAVAKKKHNRSISRNELKIKETLN